ncbi:MAG: hypothetical protein IT292_11355 [Deltaproteobacteria bacterium]|nr:hypothetical protein [Deltaproteobacteria bacterium]
MENEIREIFERITEHHSVPLRIGSRCEAHTYYRIEDLNSSNVQLCADYVAERIDKVCSPATPHLFINLPGSYTGLAEELAKSLTFSGQVISVMQLEELHLSGKKGELKGKNVVLVNDVITTARSCLEAHTKVTMLGASVLCWAALVDRTFGPGPVSVIAAFTGEPVILLENLV